MGQHWRIMVTLTEMLFDSDRDVMVKTHLFIFYSSVSNQTEAGACPASFSSNFNKLQDESHVIQNESQMFTTCTQHHSIIHSSCMFQIISRIPGNMSGEKCRKLFLFCCLENNLLVSVGAVFFIFFNSMDVNTDPSLPCCLFRMHKVKLLCVTMTY